MQHLSENMKTESRKKARIQLPSPSKTTAENRKDTCMNKRRKKKDTKEMEEQKSNREILLSLRTLCENLRNEEHFNFQLNSF